MPEDNESMKVFFLEKTDKEKLQSYQMLCAFALDGIEPDLSTKKPSAATVFQLARPILDRAHDRANKMLALAEKRRQKRKSSTTCER